MDNKYVRQFKKGSLELVLLCLISNGETYGYEIITQLNQQGGAIFGGAKEGTIYPILYRLEEMGLISSRLAAAEGRSRKYYVLTPQGQDALQNLTAFWRAFSSCVDGFLQNKEEKER